MNGKCWIYKRANLVMDDGSPPQMIHYTNGTEEFTAVVRQSPDGYPVYMWALMGEVIPIPLNIPAHTTTSIVKMGSIPYVDENGLTGQIQWECIYGKYKSLPLYYTEKLTPYLIILFLMVFIVLK